MSGTEVREAVAFLDGDPRVEVRVGTVPAADGVVLAVKPYFGGALECTLARVALVGRMCGCRRAPSA